MGKDKGVRFGFKDTNNRLSSIWRVVINGDDVYVSARAIMGEVKASLHQSEICQASFTDQFTKSDHPINEQLTTGRHIVKWRKVKFQKDNFRLMDIVIPKERLKKVPNTIKKKIEWHNIDENYLNTQVTFIQSELDLGEGQWPGKSTAATKLLYKEEIENGDILYVVYFTNNNKVNLHKFVAQANESSTQDEAYRVIEIGVDETTKVGFLIDSTADVLGD